MTDVKTSGLPAIIKKLFSSKFRAKVILFEIVLILFVALSTGAITSLYVQYLLETKAHRLSERILTDLAGVIENNYDRLSAIDEAVKAFTGTEGLVHLSYRGLILAGNKPEKVEIFVGEKLDAEAKRRLDKNVPGATNFRYAGVIRVTIQNTPAEVLAYKAPVRLMTGEGMKTLGWLNFLYAKSVIDREVALVRLLIGVIALLVIALSVYVSIRGANSVVRPVLQLTKMAKRFGEGDLNVKSGVKSADEIGILADTFDEMVVSVRQKLEMQKFVSDSTVRMIQNVTGDAEGSPDTVRHSERRFVTLFFSDIRGFTSMSEKLDPQAVVDILNDYLDAQAGIIARHGGDIDKFVGDEVMAIFEGEKAETSAVEAAREIQRKMASLNAERGKQKLPPVQIGVGINAGEVVMGSIGSHDRMDYTVIGDHVNLAARLCSNAGAAEIIVSKAVKDKLPKSIPAEALTPIQVKGKEKPIDVYRIGY